MIVLKPLDDAIANGDTIHAVIRHTGTNQDGKTSGPTMPSPEAQERLINKVYSQAGINPLDTHYVEAHGTGTAVGDPIEASAIARSLARDRPHDNPLYIGSVKSNIGHLEAGSGLAGIIKASLVLQNGLIPPNVNFEKANEEIPFESWKLKVSTLERYSSCMLRLRTTRFPQGQFLGHHKGFEELLSAVLVLVVPI